MSIIIVPFTCHSRMIRTITRFISQRPCYNACMVLVPLHHANNTIQHRGCPTGFYCRMLKFTRKIKSMCFDICFVNHVETKKVTQLIPSRMLWVMAISDCINVILLHQNQILDIEKKQNCQQIGVLCQQQSSFSYSLYSNSAIKSSKAKNQPLSCMLRGLFFLYVDDAHVYSHLE